MKKTQLLSTMLIIWIMFCFSISSTAEGPAFLEYSMELIKHRFTDPETVIVSITVTNTGNQETDSPVCLYDPDGVIIDSFGSPVLGAGESRQWIGKWRITRNQLRAGKITFMVRYAKSTGEIDTNGKPQLVDTVTTISKQIQYDPPLWETEGEWVPVLEDFFHLWLQDWKDDMLDLCSPEWRYSANDPSALLSSYLQGRTPRTWEIENAAEPEADGSVTVKVFASVKQHDNQSENDCYIIVRLISESGKWYIDPESIMNYEEITP